ncbi:hypothetical protein GQ44DRAFT_738372 [Phaeosphaeriaceae sp. PMI808]|nr:hypothetical protein GQ44DRAFT_738372 [Phaeosphaeriaceae sp. PMI808]
MTTRSPKHQHPKTTIISRRLRNRTDRALSIQPSEIRNTRPHRAATLPEPPRHKTINPQLHEPLQSPAIWGTKDITKNPPFASNLAQVGEDQSLHVLVSQNTHFNSYDSTQGLRPVLLPTEPPTTRDYQQPPNPALKFPISPRPSVSGSLDFDFLSSTKPQESHSPFVHLQDMSTLGFMMAPSQYGMHQYGSPSYSQNYPSSSQHGYAEHRSSTSGPYDSAYSSSPALSHEQRRPEEHSILPPYQAQQSSLSRGSYQQQQPSSIRSNSASTAQGYPYSNQHGNVPSQPLVSNTSNYPPPQMYPPVTYGVSDYHPLPTMYPPSSTTPAAYPSYGSSPGIPPPNDIPPLSPSPSAQGSAIMPRVLNSRPKPQCWEHGCNGRQFSTFSNLLRHQREKSGTASKSYCPRCGAEFTRTTARNGHMAHDKCKPRRASESSH